MSKFEINRITIELIRAILRFHFSFRPPKLLPNNIQVLLKINTTFEDFLISLLLSDFQRSVWSVPSISIAVLVLTHHVCELEPRNDGQYELKNKSKIRLITKNSTFIEKSLQSMTCWLVRRHTIKEFTFFWRGKVKAATKMPL